MTSKQSSLATNATGVGLSGSAPERTVIMGKNSNKDVDDFLSKVDPKLTTDKPIILEPERHELCSAFKLTVDDRTEVDARVSFTDGKPSSVTFFDSDSDSMISVPFDLWERVIAAVERTVDMQRSDS